MSHIGRIRISPSDDILNAVLLGSHQISFAFRPVLIVYKAEEISEIVFLVTIVCSERMDLRDTGQSLDLEVFAGTLIKARNTGKNIGCRKIELTDIVAHSNNIQRLLFCETAYVSSGDIIMPLAVLRKSIATIQSTRKHTIAFASLGDNVDGSISFSVIDSRHLGIVAELVYDLNLLDQVRRDSTQSRKNIVSEELLSVQKNTGDISATRFYSGIAHHDTGHFR